MRKSKYFKLYLFICVLSLGVIGSGIVFITEHKAFKNYLSSATELKEQNIILKEKLRKMEEDNSRLENENRRLKTEIENLSEFQTLETGVEKEKNQKVVGKLKGDLEQKWEEYDALKEEYNLLQEAYSELLKEKLTDSGPEQERRRRELTPEQRENFMISARERTYAMIDNRIEQAKTDYEVGLFEEIRGIYSNLFDLQDKLRTAQSNEERGKIMEEILNERRTLGELNNEYSSYQLKTLAEEYGVKNVEEFVKKSQELLQNRQFSLFGREPGPDRTPPAESRRP